MKGFKEWDEKIRTPSDKENNKKNNVLIIAIIITVLTVC